MLMKQNGLAAGEADLLGAIQAHLLASNLEKEVSVPLVKRLCFAGPWCGPNGETLNTGLKPDAANKEGEGPTMNFSRRSFLLSCGAS
jgi:hypothetical protein